MSEEGLRKTDNLIDIKDIMMRATIIRKKHIQKMMIHDMLRDISAECRLQVVIRFWLVGICDMN